MQWEAERPLRFGGLDVVPGINGVEIIKHIRSHPDLKQIPIVVLSNTYQNRLIKAAMEAGASVCVSKATCTPKMMMEIVNRFRDAMPAGPTSLPALRAEAGARDPPGREGVLLRRRVDPARDRSARGRSRCRRSTRR